MTDGSDGDDDGRRSTKGDLELLLSSSRARRRAGEMLVVLFAWLLLFSYVVGPALGFAPGIQGDDRADAGRDLPETPWEWAMTLLGTPVFFGYLFGRARLAGEPVGDYWRLREPRDGNDGTSDGGAAAVDGGDGTDDGDRYPGDDRFGNS